MTHYSPNICKEINSWTFKNKFSFLFAQQMHKCLTIGDICKSDPWKVTLVHPNVPSKDCQEKVGIGLDFMCAGVSGLWND